MAHRGSRATSAFSTDRKRACHHVSNFIGRPHPGLNVNFLPSQMAHVIALMIGAVPADLAPVVSSVEVILGHLPVLKNFADGSLLRVGMMLCMLKFT